MKFTPKELDIIMNKKVDRIIMYSKKEPVLDLPLERGVQNMIEADPVLKRELIERYLNSDG